MLSQRGDSGLIRRRLVSKMSQTLVWLKVWVLTVWPTLSTKLECLLVDFVQMQQSCWSRKRFPLQFSDKQLSHLFHWWPISCHWSPWRLKTTERLWCECWGTFTQGAFFLQFYLQVRTKKGKTLFQCYLPVLSSVGQQNKLFSCLHNYYRVFWRQI